MPFSPEKLKALRAKKGLTYLQFAPVPVITVRSLENGVRTNPTIDTLEAIAEKLGVPVVRLLVAPDNAGGRSGK